MTAGSQCVPGVPVGAQNDFRILALAAAGPSDAWLLARTPDSLGRGIVLFQRTTAGGSALPPETYTTAGDYFYVREIPASLLTGDSLRVDFQLDKAIPPSSSDIRELGIIVLTVGLESK